MKFSAWLQNLYESIIKYFRPVTKHLNYKIKIFKNRYSTMEEKSKELKKISQKFDVKIILVQENKRKQIR